MQLKADQLNSTQVATQTNSCNSAKLANMSEHTYAPRRSCYHVWRCIGLPVDNQLTAFVEKVFQDCLALKLHLPPLKHSGIQNREPCLLQWLWNITVTAYNCTFTYDLRWLIDYHGIASIDIVMKMMFMMRPTTKWLLRRIIDIELIKSVVPSSCVWAWRLGMSYLSFFHNPFQFIILTPPPPQQKSWKLF